MAAAGRADVPCLLDALALWTSFLVTLSAAVLEEYWLCVRCGLASNVGLPATVCACCDALPIHTKATMNYPRPVTLSTFGTLI